MGGLCYDDNTGYAFFEYQSVTRLYCFLGAGAKQNFASNTNQFIPEANANWNSTLAAQPSKQCENNNMFNSNC